MPSFFFSFSTAFIFHYIALFHFSYNDLQRILIFPFEILLFAFFIFIYDVPAAHANACTFPWLLHRRGYDALICLHQEPRVPEPPAPHQSAVNVPCNLMYRTLADPEFLCRLTHRSLRFNYIIRNFHSPLFNIILQKNPSACIFLQCMQKDFGVCLIKFPPETSHSISSSFAFLFPFSVLPKIPF